MSPILGIWASQNYSRIAPNSYESIATSTPSGTDVTFTSIPQTYKHLQIRVLSRTTRNDAAVDGLYLRFNGDTASNYSYHFGINGLGSGTPTSSGSANVATMVMTFSGADAQTTANVFTAYVIDILDYTNTSKYKTVRSLNGYDANGSGSVMLSSANWRNTNSVTSIRLFAEGNFVSGSHFALYGIKG